jgi:hypothetical protein
MLVEADIVNTRFFCDWHCPGNLSVLLQKQISTRMRVDICFLCGTAFMCAALLTPLVPKRNVFYGN